MTVFLISSVYIMYYYTLFFPSLGIIYFITTTEHQISRYLLLGDMQEVIDLVLCVQSAIASDLCEDALTCAGAALRRTVQIVCEFTLIPTYCCGRGFTRYLVLIVRVNERVGFYDVTTYSDEYNDFYRHVLQMVNPISKEKT